MFLSPSGGFLSRRTDVLELPTSLVKTPERPCSQQLSLADSSSSYFSSTAAKSAPELPPTCPCPFILQKHRSLGNTHSSYSSPRLPHRRPKGWAWPWEGADSGSPLALLNISTCCCLFLPAWVFPLRQQLCPLGVFAFASHVIFCHLLSQQKHQAGANWKQQMYL